MKNTAAETFKLASRFMDGTQALLENAETLFEPIDPSELESLHPPGSTLIAIPTFDEQKSMQILPVAVLKPLIGTVKQTVQSVGNVFRKGYDLTQ